MSVIAHAFYQNQEIFFNSFIKINALLKPLNSLNLSSHLTCFSKMFFTGERLRTLGNFSNKDENAKDNGSENSHSRLTLDFVVRFITVLFSPP